MAWKYANSFFDGRYENYMFHISKPEASRTNAAASLSGGDSIITAFCSASVTSQPYIAMSFVMERHRSTFTESPPLLPGCGTIHIGVKQTPRILLKFRSIDTRLFDDHCGLCNIHRLPRDNGCCRGYLRHRVGLLQ